MVTRLQTLANAVIAYDIDEFTPNGGPGGAMDHIGGHLKYVLKTDRQQYPAGTILDPRQKFELRVVVKRLGIPVFSGAVDLESR